jgi:hypothetical protein
LGAETLVGAAASVAAGAAAALVGTAAGAGAAAALVGTAAGAGAPPHPAAIIAASSTTQARVKKTRIFVGWFIAILNFLIVLPYSITT